MDATNESNIQKLQEELIQNRRLLSRKNMEMVAVQTLSKELTKVLDLGEAIDVVNRYLWELLDYTVAVYVVYNLAEGRYESRAYLKTSVGSEYLNDIKKGIVDFIMQNSDDAIVGSIAATRDMEPLLFGLEVKDEVKSSPSSNLYIPLKIGSSIVGALVLSSTKENNFNVQDHDLAEMMVSIASVSIARIQTVVQSLHSRTEALIQSLSNGVVMFDSEKQVTLANEAATRFTGLPKEGYSLDELYRLFIDVPLEEHVESALISNEVVHIARTPLARFHYEIFIVPVTNHQGINVGGAIVLHDITHIVEVDKAKTEFVSLASHQLRTPLTAIRWYTEVLMDDENNNLNEEQKDYLKEVYEGNLRMIELVNSLLNVSRLELGTFSINPEEINVQSISESVVKELVPAITTKNHTVTEEYAPDLPLLIADKNLTRMIFQNLVSNAVKYTPDNGNIEIKVTVDDEYIQIIVKDNGYGIPKAEQPQIFSKLFRADNIQGKVTEGTGLGLYIIKSVVEGVGGKVWFESEEDKGTTFFVSLPKKGMPKRTGNRKLE